MKNIVCTGCLCLILLVTSCEPIARVLKYIPSQRTEDLSFSQSGEKKFPFYFNGPAGNEYIRQLNKDYGLTDMVKDKSEIEKVQILTNWTHLQWEHSGSNAPSKPDAITILQEAKQGKKFRCVEYGIVNASVLNAIGLKARTIGLKTKDIERVKYAGGHAASEVYLPSLGKWVFADAQYNVIPFLNNKPLNAVELQNAIRHNSNELELRQNGLAIGADKKSDYLKFTAKYLFYFDIWFDNSIGEKNKQNYNGFYKLMLVPQGMKEPETFQRVSKINAIYTNSVTAFYEAP